MEISRTSRLKSIDALRGLAVLLMIDQHLVSWLCGSAGRSTAAQIIGAPGGLAAPIFVVLAGLGVTLTTYRYQATDRLLLVRGLGIIGFGYLLNALTPSWFSIGSWYVLHMIGFGIILSPMLTRLSSPVLCLLLVLILVSTVLIQNGLHTPFHLYNRQMSSLDSPGGVLRHALAEGYFPIFPWGAFFVVGILAGRWLTLGDLKTLRRMAAALLLTSVALSACYALGLTFTRSHALIRVFKVVPTFYPALTPMSLFLMSMALAFILLFVSIESRSPFRSSGFLVCLGRTSLTLLIAHVVIIRGTAVGLGFFRSLSLLSTVATIAAVLVLVSVLAVFWGRIGFRFGAEWLLRKVSG